MGPRENKEAKILCSYCCEMVDSKIASTCRARRCPIVRKDSVIGQFIEGIKRDR